MNDTDAAKEFVKWLKSAEGRVRLERDIERTASAQGVAAGVYVYTVKNRLHGAGLSAQTFLSRMSEESADRARRPRKKKWAVELAEQMAADFERFPDAWGSIDPDGLHFWRDDENNVRYSGPDGNDYLDRESFRTGYFVPAKKKIR